MHEPAIEYSIASPYGNFPVKKEKLHFPLEGDKAATAYKKYFWAIKTFISQNHYALLLSSIAEKLNHSVSLKEIKKISIRAQKHGAFYHPASIEIVINNQTINLGVNVATEKSKIEWLKKEFFLLKNLGKTFKDLSYLPKVFGADYVGDMFITLVEWFDDYHEFHLSLDEKKQPKIIFWDFKNGYRYLHKEEEFRLYKEIAKILTLYYNIKTFSQIYPWHHAAGDFVANIKHNKIAVKLTTVRGYEPIVGFIKDNNINPIFALIQFFLILSLKMRLDKFDGIGEIGWLGNFCVKATVEGFFEALKIKEREMIQICEVSCNEFLELLKSFTEKEIEALFAPLLDWYHREKDFPVIMDNIKEHKKSLYLFIQEFPL